MAWKETCVMDERMKFVAASQRHFATLTSHPLIHSTGFEVMPLSI